jgi:hypothetical protein
MVILLKLNDEGTLVMEVREQGHLPRTLPLDLDQVEEWQGAGAEVLLTDEALLHVGHLAIDI